MLPSKEELKNQFQSKSTEDLLSILNQAENYRKEAIEIINEELDSRNVDREEVKAFVDKQAEKEVVKKNNAEIGLSLFWKVFTFVLWFTSFIGFAYKMNWREDGMDRKIKQSRYYTVTGAISMFVTTLVILSIPLLGNTGSLLTMAVLFMISLSMEKKFINTNKA